MSIPRLPLGLVVPRVAELVLLDALVDAEWEDSTWWLFGGSVTPGLDDTTYTYRSNQVTWPGIVNPTASGWGSASIGTDSFAVAVGPPLQWTFSSSAGNVKVNGVFALDSAGNLLGAELIPTGPVELSQQGQVLPYTPQVSLRSAYGSDSV